MARRPIFAANWKMHKTPAEAEAFVRALREHLHAALPLDIVLAPPAPALERTAAACFGSDIEVAAQNVHPEAKGAFTGEISVAMLSAIGCEYAIVGHSERRALFGESDDFVASKARAVLAGGLRPIVCVGEQLEERESGVTLEVIHRQLTGSLAGIPADQCREVVVAYEPVWAIGTGKTATPEIAQEVHSHARSVLAELFGAAAEEMRIQYGGSVKPDNAAALMAQPDIDGALVGGASLEADSFSRILQYDP